MALEGAQDKSPLPAVQPSGPCSPQQVPGAAGSRCRQPGPAQTPPAAAWASSGQSSAPCPGAGTARQALMHQSQHFHHDLFMGVRSALQVGYQVEVSLL